MSIQEDIDKAGSFSTVTLPPGRVVIDPPGLEIREKTGLTIQGSQGTVLIPRDTPQWGILGRLFPVWDSSVTFKGFAVDFRGYSPQGLSLVAFNDMAEENEEPSLINLSGLTIDLRPQVSTSRSRAIPGDAAALFNDSGSSARDCIVNGGNLGFWVFHHPRRSSTFAISKCVFRNQRLWGILLQQEVLGAIDGCDASGSLAEHGIYLHGRQVTVRNCVLHGNAVVGLRVGGDPNGQSQFIVAGCQIYDNRVGGFGIGGYGVGSLEVSGCKLWNNSAAFCFWDGPLGDPENQNIVLSGNEMENNRTGVDIENARGLTIVGNTFKVPFIPENRRWWTWSRTGIVTSFEHDRIADLQIVDNTIEGFDVGIWLPRVRGARILRNSFQKISGIALFPGGWGGAADIEMAGNLSEGNNIGTSFGRGVNFGYTGNIHSGDEVPWTPDPPPAYVRSAGNLALGKNPLPTVPAIPLPSLPGIPSLLYGARLLRLAAFPRKGSFGIPEEIPQEMPNGFSLGDRGQVDDIEGLRQLYGL